MNLDTMTVGELKALLARYQDDRPVCFSYPSGDFWRTQLVSPIKGIERAEATYSEYHKQFQLAEDGETTLLILR